jgi:hypothetical protein
LSCRELITGDALVAPVRQDQPITIELFDNPYSRPGFLHQKIAGRGIDAPSREGGVRSSGTEGPVKLVSG